MSLDFANSYSADIMRAGSQYPLSLFYEDSKGGSGMQLPLAQQILSSLISALGEMLKSHPATLQTQNQRTNMFQQVGSYLISPSSVLGVPVTSDRYLEWPLLLPAPQMGVCLVFKV